MNLSALDLNLLVAFQALVEERHVSRAARRIGLSQPAMSNVLARLRRTFGDEILVRTPQGMQLTTKAMALAGPVRAALAQLEDALSEQSSFDPLQAQCTFTLGMADYTSLVILPRLKRRIAEQAPQMNLVVVNSVRGQGLTLVDRGEADLAIGRLPDPPPHLRIQRVFRERLVCMARPDHPSFHHGLTLKEYIMLPHLQVRTMNDPPAVDRILESLGLQRRVEIVLPHFLMVPILLAETDLVATEPERLALRFTHLPLSVQPPPFESPTVNISMVWHGRHDRNPAHMWLRNQIAQIEAC